MSRSASKSVFVGNIPYDATEEQLVEIFKEVGPVASFRLVFDKETGKPKGYGFCDYHDASTAQSAIRNLSGREFNGRTLRVDSADEKGSGGGGGGRGDQGGGGGGGGPSHNMAPDNGPMGGPGGPSMPPANQPPQSTMQNDIAKLLEGMSTTQLYETMVQLKGMLQQNPEQVRKLLASYPQLTYALLQAQILLGMVPANIAQQLVAQPAMPGPPQHAPPGPGFYPQNLPPNVMKGAPGFNQGLNQFSPQYLTAAPVMAPPQGYAPPMQPHTQPVAQQPAPGLPTDQQALLDQVLALTPQQIDSLPPQERAQILELRQAVMGMRR